VNDSDAIAALVSDLQWQVEQLKPRGIKDNAGNPYNPSYYKRGLQAAINRGGTEVASYIRRYIAKPPSDGYRKLEEADSLDLACEALVADEDKPYAYLFSDEDREAARRRLAPYTESIRRRKAERASRVERRQTELPDDLVELRALASDAEDPEESIAVNLRILERADDDVVALNRLGRAYEAIGALERAEETFRRALEVAPGNTIAERRLTDVVRRLKQR
jgi:tetratricopeptide (TPR) repeat protein